ncbi:MmcQ/YjbR family DNA-binding protein [Gaiella sp.]|uniref:MmcQ/YjbR family DNA-binding protein n=1 Tax=Gaiella sp. TaxID=2663207 RepID=UPI003264FC5E
MTWSDVVTIAEALPEVEVGTGYGTPPLRVQGKCMGRLREDGKTLAIRCDPDERPLLLETQPDCLFLAPHYGNWPMGLVALPHASLDLVRGLVEDAWAECAPRKLVRAYRTARGGAQ